MLTWVIMITNYDDSDADEKYEDNTAGGLLSARMHHIESMAHARRK